MFTSVNYRSRNAILEVERDDGNESFNSNRNSKVEHLNCPASRIFRLAVCLDLGKCRRSRVQCLADISVKWKK